MSSPAANLPEKADDAKDGGFPIGARVSTEDLKLIDLARVHGGYANRAEFIAAAVLEKTREVLKDLR